MGFTEVKRLVDTMPRRGIPFFELVVTKDGKEVFRHRVGNSDPKQEKPFEKDDLYWLYSATKVVTCVCAMRLIEEGKISLNDPVSKYIPSFANLTVRQSDGSVKPCKTVMTVEHLFTMTGGIGPDHESVEALTKTFSANPNASTFDVVSGFADTPLYFEPGTRYQYGFCHDALGAVIEVASGMKLSDYMQKFVFDPLGMKNTGFRPTEEQKKRFTATYNYDNSNGTSQLIPTENKFMLAPNYDSGGAGLFSCAEDYIKFITVLANGGTTKDGYCLLSEDTIKEMEVNRLCPQALKDFVNGRLHGYGWGLCGRVHMNPVYSLSKSSVGEFGWDGMAGCFSMVDRKNRVAIFYGMSVVNCTYSYIILQPLIRTLVFKALEG
ncbi:MAG: beta-lactamase family protein [Ruminococcaceae bacterium]|nr:beta-lactamase family protein [Oscillospiraceae bacterium]